MNWSKLILILVRQAFIMPAKKPFLLIVDDDLPTLKLYQRELSVDFHVVICQDSHQAASLLQTPGLCAVVLEPTMSDGKGWNLLVTMRTQDRARRFPVILCSSSDEKKRGLDEGAAVFLTKPVLPGDLRETLRRILAGYHN